MSADRNKNTSGTARQSARNGGRASVNRRRGQNLSASRNIRSDPDGKSRREGERIPVATPAAPTRRESREIKRAEKEAKWSEGIERVRSGHDWIFFIIVMVLISIGTVMVYSASYPSAIAEGHSGFYYVGRQIFWIAIGVVAMFLMSYTPAVWVKKAAPVIYIFTLILLAAVPVIGKSVNGAKRWIQITSQVRIQPSEIAKLAVVVILAWYVGNNKHKFQNAESRRDRFIHGVFKPSLFIFLLAGMVLIEKHLSGTVIIVAIGVIVMFLAGADWKLMIPYYLGIGGAASAAYLILNPYALRRILTYTNENADILDEKWQTYQGTLAIGSGGFLGLGLGQSRQKFSYVSEAQNDFIFTIWCEEMGFVGAIIIIALFVALVFRGYRIALRSPDVFSSLIVFGIVTQVGLQAFLNLMVVTDVIPNTGISLPFLSYGGSSLVMMMAEMGIVLSISRQSYQKIQ